MKATKQKIAEGVVAGGLHDLKQQYRINYLEREKSFTDKIELALTLIKEGKTDLAYRSLRFTSTEQLKSFIQSLMTAYFYFHEKRNKPQIHLDTYRNMHLRQVITEFMNNQRKIWSEEFKYK